MRTIQTFEIFETPLLCGVGCNLQIWCPCCLMSSKRMQHRTLRQCTSPFQWQKLRMQMQGILATASFGIPLQVSSSPTLQCLQVFTSSGMRSGVTRHGDCVSRLWRCHRIGFMVMRSRGAVPTRCKRRVAISSRVQQLASWLASHAAPHNCGPRCSLHETLTAAS